MYARVVRIHLKSPLFWLWLGIGTYWSALAVLRHNAGETAAFDLGIFQQVLWNITHGHGYWSSLKGEISLWADHQSPVLGLFVPFFALAPRSETLLIIQAFAVAAGVFPLFSYARAIAKGAAPFWKKNLPWIAIGLFFLSQPIRAAVLFDFHPEILFLPLGLAVLDAWQNQRKTYWIWSILCLGTKETAAVSGIALAIVLFLQAREMPRTEAKQRMQRAWGLGLSSVLWLVFCVVLLPRLFSQPSHAYADFYSGWGSGWSAILLAPLRSPVQWVKHFLEPTRLGYLWKLSAAVGFAFIFSQQGWRFAAAAGLAALPVLLMTDLHRTNPHYHYGIEPSLALLAGALWGLRVVPSHFVRRALVLVFFIAFLRGGTLGIPQAIAWAKGGQSEPLHTLLQVTLPKLHQNWSPEVRIAVTERWAPRFASRRHLYLIANAAEQNAQWIVTHPDDPQIPRLLGQGYRRHSTSQNCAILERKSANPDR